MPGRELPGAASPVDPVTEALLADAKITAEDFSRAAAFVHTKFDGAYRPIALKTEIQPVIDGKNLRLMFTLPPGHYATTVCREYMKADPVRMI
jgi:tRNA pseudouridine13 synthase